MDDSSGPLWALIFFVLFIIINGVLYGFGSAVQKVSESEIEKKAKEEGDKKSLWLFPQGIIRPPMFRPIEFQTGLAYIAKNVIGIKDSLTGALDETAQSTKALNDTYKKKDSIFRIGYLGRLSPRKNIESLIYALAELKSEKRQAELLIIGGGDNKYERFLRDEAQRLKLDNVFFTGFLSGKKKDEAIASLSILVMPSEFENFGNVILEGLIRGIPCIATKGSPWKELVTRQCGWWIDYEQETINKTIKEAMRIPPYQLATMGERGIQLIKDNYSQEKVAAKMKELYEWICGKTDKPQFTFMQ